MTKQALKAYGENRVTMASPAQLVVMLYDKAIQSLQDAIDGIKKEDINKRWINNNKAVEIITHLQLTLDHEKGGEIAFNLNRIYDFMQSHLMFVDTKNDAKYATEVIALLETLRNSWQELARQEMSLEDAMSSENGQKVLSEGIKSSSYGTDNTMKSSGSFTISA